MKNNTESQQEQRGIQSPPFPESYTYQGALYISGQIAIDKSGLLVNAGFEAEAKQVMENIGRVLQRAGLHYKNLVSVTIFLTSMENYAALNAVYRTYFDRQFPARVCIAVKALPLGANIEITAIAGFNN